LTGFAGFPHALSTWFFMQMTIFLIFPVFKLWAVVTKKFFLKSGILTNCWHFGGVVCYIAFQATFIVFFTKMIISVPLGQASGVASLMELVRFMMKSHAFVRTNVPRVLRKVKVDDSDYDSEESKKSSDSSIGTSSVNDKQQMPTIGQFLYFLFAPTLVYRDEYPRSKYVRWGFVTKCFTEVGFVIFIMSFISERFMFPAYNQFGSQFYEVGVSELLGSVFNSMLPSLLCLVCGFYCILHSWMNAFAEMLKFSDRQFYRDWWNASNFSAYYRTWNGIVHDWLYVYVYKDIYYHVCRRNQLVSQLLVFTLSAIFHEFIMTFTFRCFYPILFVMFQGAGVALIFVTKKESKSIGNIIMWLSLAMGMGILMSAYHMEFYARRNCEFDQSNLKNFFIPISWSCNGLKFSDNWEIKMQA